MFSDDSFKINRVELAIQALSQVLQRLHEYDYTSAQVRVAFARQMLEELQMDFDLHFQAEEMLERLLEQSF